MIAADEMVGEVMRRFPQTIRVFLDFRFDCVGCPIAGLQNVADAALAHGCDLNVFLSALNQAVQNNEADSPPPAPVKPARRSRAGRS